MDRRFNVTGSCNPERHYMVDISARLDAIVSGLISRGEYFTINRARQYGKTTTLKLLGQRLSGEYVAINITFEGNEDWFESFPAFNKGFCFALKKMLAVNGYGFLTQSLDETAEEANPQEVLRQRISRLCEAAGKPVVLMIDEVDRSTDYEVFSRFLGILRSMYLDREWFPTFHSVILAGVHDIKNLKKKIRPESEHSYNSPWNIAADFDVDMSFSTVEIQSMLDDYEADHGTGMDTVAVASQIRFYTGGYPFLVSRLCKIIDEKPLEWSVDGVDEAETKLLMEDNTLFDDLARNVLNNGGLRALLESILLGGAGVGYDPDDPVIKLGRMYGILVSDGRRTGISNIIFETRITNLLISVSATRRLTESYAHDGVFVRDGKLDMDAVASRFSAFMKSEYRDGDGVFVESHARLLLLSFIKGIVNGTGHYAVEPRTRNDRRMDVVVYYGKEKFIIELKIWRGEAYEAKGYDQLADCLDSQGERKGWLISFASTGSSPRKDRVFVHRGSRSARPSSPTARSEPFPAEGGNAGGCGRVEPDSATTAHTLSLTFW